MFADEVDLNFVRNERNARMRGWRKVVGRLLHGVDGVWKWAGARHAVQVGEEIGLGFVGWAWRGSVYSEV
jgi:hypothetical protein